MPFGLKNVPAIFSLIVVASYKEFIHKFLEVYFDDWTMFGLLKKNVSCYHSEKCETITWHGHTVHLSKVLSWYKKISFLHI